MNLFTRNKSKNKYYTKYLNKKKDFEYVGFLERNNSKINTVCGLNILKVFDKQGEIVANFTKD